MPELGYVIAIGAFLVIMVLLLRVRQANQIEEISTGFVPATPNPATSAPYVPTGDFRMTIQDTFDIRGRGLVVTGRVESGSVVIGQQVGISAPDGSQTFVTQIGGLEAFHRELVTANAGDHVGILLPGLTKAQIKPGMIIVS